MANGKEVVQRCDKNDEYDELEYEMIEKWKIPAFPEIIQLKMSTNTPVEWKNCAIGRFFAPRHVENSSIQKELRNSWKAVKRVQVEVLDTGYFKIKFECERDLRFVLKNGPWQVEGYVFSTKVWKPNTQLEEYPFCWVPMWIQIFGLPLERKEPVDLYDIAAAFGRDTIEVDSVGGKDKSGSFARIHVLFHIKRPLIKAAAVKIGDKMIRIRFKYERLPLFCYFCGVIGHNFKICPDYLNHSLVIQSEGHTPVKEILRFSGDLRAKEVKMGTGIIQKCSFNLDPEVAAIEGMELVNHLVGGKNVVSSPVTGEVLVADSGIQGDAVTAMEKNQISSGKDGVMDNNKENESNMCNEIEGNKLVVGGPVPIFREKYGSG
ncbi:zinc ion binding / nucleic acid binding protein [Thalictrum thalictroides]|uniref:Zinc ion binding / nucleic acid binding protein n=1 Tax=Thalictrum thalictroides TaxID=46969 RepID=A0A7J6W8F6_THATH|nr:zinc ion binding / nucleic acid binding protein [Thalictrum thalictroides]